MNDLSILAMKQVPYAAHLAVGAVAKEVREKAHDEMARKFHKPTPNFTLKSMWVDYPGRYTRGVNSTAVIKLSTERPKGRSGVGTKYYDALSHQFTGGDRVRTRLEKAFQTANLMAINQYIAPGSGALLDKYDNMRPGQATKILSYFRAFPEIGYVMNRANKYHTRQERLKASKRDVFFIIKGGDAGNSKPPGVWQRLTGRRNKLIYKFIKKPRYRPIISFHETARETIAQSWGIEFRKAMIKAVEGARVSRW